jgi:hypothetical protein
VELIESEDEKQVNKATRGNKNVVVRPALIPVLYNKMGKPVKPKADELQMGRDDEDEDEAQSSIDKDQIRCVCQINQVSLAVLALDKS